jgi:hypothetical protein
MVLQCECRLGRYALFEAFVIGFALIAVSFSIDLLTAICRRQTREIVYRSVLLVSTSLNVWLTLKGETTMYREPYDGLPLWLVRLLSAYVLLGGVGSVVWALRKAWRTRVNGGVSGAR